MVFFSTASNGAGLRRCFFWLAVFLLPALTGCKGIIQSKGSIEVLDYADAPYSWQGATVELFRLTRESALAQTARPTIGLGRIQNDEGMITLHVREAALEDERWYGIEVRCPRRQPGRCDLTSPLHLVVSGADVKAGGWKITALTEAAFQTTGYAVAAGFTSGEIRQVLDNAARVLLADATADDYEDVLAWDPADSAAVRRPEFLALLDDALYAGASQNELKLLVQRWSAITLGSLGLPSYANAVDVAVEGRYAVMARGGSPDAISGIDLVDVSDPLNPDVVGVLNSGAPGDVTAVDIQGNYIYVAGDSDNSSSQGPGALYVASIFNPAQPDPAGIVDLPEGVGDLVVAGNHAYVTQSQSDRLVVIDVSDPFSPTEVASLAIGSSVERVFATDNRVWVLGQDGLAIVNVENPAAPVLIATVALPNGAVSFALIDDLAYVGEQGSDLYVIDVNADAPSVIASVDLLDTAGKEIGAGAILVDGDLVYVHSGNQLFQLDMSNPQLPHLLRGGEVVGGGRSVIANGLIYSVDFNDGLQILDPNGIRRVPVLESTLDIEGGLSPRTVASEQTIFSAIVEDGVSYFSLEDPLAPVFLTKYTERWALYPIALSGQYAFLGDLEYGAVRVQDVSNPAEPIDLPGVAYFDEEELFGLKSVVADGNRVYATWGYRIYDDSVGEYLPKGGLFVVDVQNPEDPTVMAQIPFNHFAGPLAAQGDYAYVTVDGQLHVVDVSDAAAPVIAGSLSLPADVVALSVSGDFVYAGSGTAGVQVINVSNPASPRLATVLDTAGVASTIVVQDGFAYVTDGPAGVLALDLANPAFPHVIGSADVRSSARTVFLQHGWLYAVTGQGLDILKRPGPVTD